MDLNVLSAASRRARLWLAASSESIGHEQKRKGSLRRILGATACLIVAPLWGDCRASTVTYYYTDPQGTVLATADAAGNILSASNYSPFGRRVSDDASSGPGYTGHVDDTSVGLVYMQARYLDPEIGRFLSVDPAALEPGDLNSFNRTAYANDNPMRYVDPDGKQACDYCNQSVGPGVYVGASMLGAGNARASYTAQAATLGSGETVQRAALKAEARAETPSMVRNVVSQLRPSLDPKVGSGGRANVTNGVVNKLGTAARWGGAALVVVGLGTSALEVATSGNPTRTLAVVGGGLLGAAAGGEAGVAAGTAGGAAAGGPPGAVAGAIAGGLAGSTAGALVGREAGGKLYDAINPVE